MTNLSTPYLAELVADLGLHGDYQAAYYDVAWPLVAFLWEAAAVVANLVLVQLYLELARARDGVAPRDVVEVFA